MRIQVTGQAELGRLATRLRRAADGGLQRDVNAALMQNARPVLRETRSVVRGASFPDAMPAGSGAHSGFRVGLARATQLKAISNGVRFTVDGRLVGKPRGHSLAQLSDTELAPRWRHPTYGRKSRSELTNRNRRGPNRLWRTQIGQPWFFVTIRGGRHEYEAAVELGIAKTARRIEG